MSHISAPSNQFYSLHGINVELSCDDPDMVNAIHAVLEYFGFENGKVNSTEPTLRLSLQTKRPSQVVLDGAVQITEHNGIQIWKIGERFIFLERDSVVELDLEAGSAQGTLRSEPWSKPGVLRIEFVNLVIHSVLLLMRRHRFYPLHAAAVATNGVGCLLVARSDSGKSTQAMSLVREGWQYLSDDSILLRQNEDLIEARSLRRDFGLDQDAVKYFPEIEGHWRPFLTDEKKRRVNMKALYPDQAITTCTPRLLMFPQIVAEPISKVTKISDREALFKLMEQSILLDLAPEIATKHLAVLQRLVKQTDCYELRAGFDLRENPAVITQLLQIGSFQ